MKVSLVMYITRSLWLTKGACGSQSNLSSLTASEDYDEII